MGIMAGDGGAGDGGAGDGGAGDGGAGDGGAGDGGAGIARAGTSQALSRALITTRDALVGYWKGDGDAPPDPLSTHADLSYLPSGYRRAMLETALHGLFSVEDAAAGKKPVEKNAIVRLRPGVEIYRCQRPGNDQLVKELKYVRNHADLRLDRTPEIVAQKAALMPFFGLAHRLDSSGKERSMDLLAAVQGAVFGLELQVKHICYAPRPNEFSPRVAPMIQTPPTSSFPSGHAAEAFAIAAVLHRLATGGSAWDGLGAGGTADPALPFRIAFRIAVNRTVAGVHFPSDTMAGALLGCLVGDAIGEIADGRKEFRGGEFRPDGTGSDVTLGDIRIEQRPSRRGGARWKPDPSAATLVSAWRHAKGEWA